MYDIVFYQDRRGRIPVLEYWKELDENKDKDSCIKAKKIYDYMGVLKTLGLSAGEPYIKHLEGEIWELRPLRDRILFAAWRENRFVLLHYFTKKTQKTPRREIEQAIRNLNDLREREG